MFAVEGPLWWALVLYAGVGAVALPFAVWQPLRRPSPFAIGVGLAGVGFGIALWSIAGQLDGDALFHLARIRKLEAFDNLTLDSVNEFVGRRAAPRLRVSAVARADGGRGLARRRRLGGCSPPRAERARAGGVPRRLRGGRGHPAHGVGRHRRAARSRRADGARARTAAARTRPSRCLPPRRGTCSRRRPWRRSSSSSGSPGWAAGLTAAAASLALALVHPTYVIFVAVPLGGYVLARLVLARGELARGAAGLAFVLLPAAAVAAWLAPTVRDTASHNPSAVERARGLAHYPGQVDIFSPDSFRLAPEMLGRPGAVAIAALVVVPLAALASRRRWSAYVLGGSVALLAILLLQDLFTPFSDAVSLSQARRAAGFVPLAVAFAGGAAVLARLISWWALPAALSAGIALELAYPGEFTYTLDEGRAGHRGVDRARGRHGRVDRRRRARQEREGGRPRAAVRGGRRGLRPAGGDLRLRPLGCSALRALPAQRRDSSSGSSPCPRAPSSSRTTRRATGRRPAAPIYIATARPGHVADTDENRPYERRDDANRFGRTGDLSIPRRYRADFVLVRRDRWPRLDLSRPVVYRDGRYVLYRL